jgi:hypothetical protein
LPQIGGGFDIHISSPGTSFDTGDHFLPSKSVLEPELISIDPVRLRPKCRRETIRQVLLGRVSYVPPEPGKLRCPLPHTVIFATAQKQSDLPDVAVATSLSAYLTRIEKTQPVVVMLPKYLEADRTLEQYLRDRGITVSRGLVIGGQNAVSDELRKLLRSVTAVAGATTMLQATSGLFEKLLLFLALLVGAGVVGVATSAAAGAVTEAAPHVRDGLRSGIQAIQSGMKTGRTVDIQNAEGDAGGPQETKRTPSLFQRISGKTGEPNMAVSSTDKTQEADPVEALRSAIITFGADDVVWVRLRLKQPSGWVAGKLHPSLGTQPAASPFPEAKALWLREVVKCNPETGELDVPPGPETKPLLRANALAVRWDDIQIVEIVNSKTEGFGR